MSKPEPPMTDIEVSAWTRVPRATLKAWRTRGGGPKFIRVNGRSVRYRPADVRAWLAEHEVAA